MNIRSAGIPVVVAVALSLAASDAAAAMSPLAPDQPGGARVWKIITETTSPAVEQMRKAVAAMRAGNTKQALTEIETAIRLDPNYLDAYGLRGEILTVLRDTAALEANYKAWLARAPTDPRPDASFASALLRLGERDRARAAAERSIALGPVGLAYATRAALRPPAEAKAALEDLDKAIQLSPNLPVAYVMRAELRMRAKDYPGSLADLERALPMFPPAARYPLLIARAAVYERTGAYEAALKDMDEVIAGRPADPRALNERCWVRATWGKGLDLALADCDAALKAAPGDSPILDSRGLVQLRRGAYAASIADYDAALKARPNQPTSLYGRGVARLRSGAKAAGEADLAAARKLSPEVEGQFAGWGVKP